MTAPGPRTTTSSSAEIQHGTLGGHPGTRLRWLVADLQPPRISLQNTCARQGGPWPGVPCASPTSRRTLVLPFVCARYGPQARGSSFHSWQNASYAGWKVAVSGDDERLRLVAARSATLVSRRCLLNTRSTARTLASTPRSPSIGCTTTALPSAAPSKSWRLRAPVVVEQPSPRARLHLRRCATQIPPQRVACDADLPRDAPGSHPASCSPRIPRNRSPSTIGTSASGRATFALASLDFFLPFPEAGRGSALLALGVSIANAQHHRLS